MSEMIDAEVVYEGDGEAECWPNTCHRCGGAASADDAGWRLPCAEVEAGEECTGEHRTLCRGCANTARLNEMRKNPGMRKLLEGGEFAEVAQRDLATAELVYQRCQVIQARERAAGGGTVEAESRPGSISGQDARMLLDMRAHKEMRQRLGALLAKRNAPVKCSRCGTYDHYDPCPECVKPNAKRDDYIKAMAEQGKDPADMENAMDYFMKKKKVAA